MILREINFSLAGFIEIHFMVGPGIKIILRVPWCS
jgi:hypothetical protein